MKIRSNLILLLILPFLVLHTQEKGLISITNLRANLEVLASDEFEGREAATRGDRLSQLFIISELKKSGVKPLPEYPDYRMPVELTLTKISDKSTFTLDMGVGEVKKVVRFGEEIVSWSKYRSDTVLNYPVIFAGYGLEVPEQGWNDYEGLDVRGKLVIIASGVPKALNPENDPAVEEEYSGAKLFTAYGKGAAGIIFTGDKSIEEEWSSLSKPAISLPSKASTRNPGRGVFLMKEEGLKKLLSGSPLSYAEYIQKKEAGEKLPVFVLGVSGTLDIMAKQEAGYTTNIIGYVEGSDPVLKEEFVALGAHYDHVGIDRGQVYNGADDDGSGIVAVLEAARALVSAKKIKRSVLVVLHGAEEKGLLGASYLSDNFGRMDKIIAQINIDMVGREHQDSIYSVGSDKISSELKAIVEEVNKKTVKFAFNYKFDEPDDPNRIYERSDHYHYARKGIPVVFFYDYMLEDYHKPTDDIEKINFEKIRKVSELMYHLSIRLANLDKRLTPDERPD